MLFIRPSPNSTSNCHYPKRTKFLSRIRLGSSHLALSYQTQLSGFSQPLQKLWKSRSNRLQMFFEIGVLKNFVISTGKYLCRNLFKQRCRPSGLSYCEISYCQSFKNSFVTEHLWWFFWLVLIIFWKNERVSWTL